MLRMHTFPRAFTAKFNSLECIISDEASTLVSRIEGVVKIKPFLLESIGNIFVEHFCSRTFNRCEEFTKMTSNFDEIFYEVNQGYAADFLPFLLPFHASHLEKISRLAHEIRAFVQ
ncbi:putative cytochrome P450, partial [Trypoxylus dichotomus]